MKRMILIALILVLTLTACSGPVVLTSPSIRQTTSTVNPAGDLNRASDYAALIKLIRQAQANNANQYPNRYFMTAEKSSNMADAAGSQAPTRAGSDYSQTNIQVEGVDEADIIKTDGQYLYLVANNRLYIVDARDPSSLKVLSETRFITANETDKVTIGESPLEMYLDPVNKRLILVVNGWMYEKVPIQETTTSPETKVTTNTSDKTDPASETASAPETRTASEPAASVAGTVQTTDSTEAGISREGKMIAMPYYWANNKQYTTTRIYDISDRANPKIVRQFTQEGYYVSSRRIENNVYIVTNQYKYPVYAESGADPKPAEVFPQTRDSLDAISDQGWEVVAANKISVLPTGDSSNQMVLAAIDTLSDSAKPDVMAILGSSGTVYASTQYLYVAAYNYRWDGKETTTPSYSTDIYRFKLSGATIREAGKGSVEGYLLNQFSMDEFDGYFRIATTVQNWTEKSSTVRNNVYVLDGSLKVVGSVEGLAEGETIKSVRFMGSQVYVVTFRNVDPLFVIDLSQPKAPKVLGQLKIPGYSTYLHPYGEHMLLGFGYDVKTEGNNAYNLGLKVSLFDISDFNQPREVSTILLGGRGSSADILYNHKSLLFSQEKNLIAFPAQLLKTVTGSSLEYGQPVFQGLLILAVKDQNQLILRGSVTHFDRLQDPDGKPAALNEKESQAFYGYDAINRSAWIGGVLFTYSARQIRSTQIDSLAPLGQVELPGYEEYQQNYYYGGNVRGIMVD